MDIILARDISLQFLRAEMLRRIKRYRKHVNPATIVEYSGIIKMSESELKTFFETLLSKEDVDGSNVFSRPASEIALDIMIVQAHPGHRKLVDDPKFVTSATTDLQISEEELRTYVDFLGEERQRRFHLA